MSHVAENENKRQSIVSQSHRRVIEEALTLQNCADAKRPDACLARVLASRAARWHSRQQVGRSPLNVLHAARIGEGPQIQLDKHLALARMRQALVEAHPQPSPVRGVFVHARIVLPLGAHHPLMCWVTLALGKTQ